MRQFNSGIRLIKEEWATSSSTQVARKERRVVGVKTALLGSVLLISFAVGCSKNDEILVSQRADGLSYDKNSETPFTGSWTAEWKNGGKRFERKYNNGRQQGASTVWYENGQKKEVRNYKDGKHEGALTCWYENGQKQRESDHVNGRIVGVMTEWYENGQKRREGTLEDGFTNWYEEGQICSITPHKDGKPHGDWIMYFRDGKKWWERTYQDGKLIKEIDYTKKK